MIPVKFHIICRAALKIAPRRCEIFDKKKKDKDLEDEQCMMENHRCYGEGKALAV